MLEPYVVLDFTDERGELGPMLLGDLGADVIRVELPGGSQARHSLPRVQVQANAGQSLQFQAFNRNKRSIVLDPDDPEDATVLENLLTRADFVFESWPHGDLQARGIDFESICRYNPSVVYVRISAFGSDGPHAHMHAADLTIAAMGGPVGLQGVPERAPVRLSVPQVWRHAGAEAAVAAMAAHTRRVRTGQGQFVDLSAQCAMTWTMLNSMEAFAIQGFDFQRAGHCIYNGPTKVQLVYPTADGHIVAVPYSKVLAPLSEWMIAEGVADATLREVDWQAYDTNVANPDYGPFNAEAGMALCRKFFARHTKDELFQFGLANRISLAPVNTLQELLDLDHLEARSYWVPGAICDVQGKAVKAPGLWAKPTSGGMSVRTPAPALDAHGQEIRAAFGTPATDKPHYGAGDEALPFAGLTVTDFAWVGVGPISSKFLADHGATVYRIESETRPDVLRINIPNKDNVPGINRSQFFGDFNTSKKSIALDMKFTEAIEVARRFIEQSDVVIESFAPGAIERMGLGYEALSAINPGLIMVSTCLMGQTGPASSLAGYGYHAGAIAGFYEVTGWPDLGPNGPWIAYTDTIAPRFVSTLLAAALDHRRRTGEGCYIDLAQIEAALHFLAPELLDLQVNGHMATRMGNRSRFYAPQGCYPCDGEDRWVAIAVETEAQWQALCETIGQADWVDDPAFADRHAAHDVIDAGIIEWTQPRPWQTIVDTLQSAGVPAGLVQRSSDLLADPQYAHRQFYRYMDHPEMGHIPYAGHQYRIQGYDNGPQAPAPCLGEHTFEILSDVIGLTAEEIAAGMAGGYIN